MFDGKADSSNFKAEYCGSQAPADFVSGGNLVTMNVSRDVSKIFDFLTRIT